MKAAPKKKSPVRLSGNAGTRYENNVAARFLLDMLVGTNSVGVEFGRILRIDWQARDLGWLTDDAVLTCRAPGDETRRVGLSMKSDKQITSNGFPDDFVDLAWGQRLGVRTSGAFHDGKDAVALVTAKIANGVLHDWSALLHEILSTTPDRIVARINADANDGSQASPIQRALVESFACPARYDQPLDQVEAVRFLHDIRVLVFDFNQPTSRDRGIALSDCQRLLTSGDVTEARDLWERLVGIADELRPAGGALELPALLAKLRKFDLHDHPDFRADLAALRKRTAEETDDIETQVGAVAQISRENDLKAVRDRLASARACLLVGESGSGKSALVKAIAVADYPFTVWLSRDALNHANASAFESALGLRHSLIDVLRHSVGPCLVVFDGIEGYSDRALRLCANIVAKIQDPNLAHVQVAFTNQYEASAKITLLQTLGVPQSMLAITTLNPIDESQVHELLSSFPELQWIATRPDLGPLLTNLKVLDWFARLGPRSEANAKGSDGITTVIDLLWSRWTESQEDGLIRSHLLMTLATTQADTLSHGLPRTQLDASIQSTLHGLAQSGLIRIRNDRVLLTHDLLGDWARLKLLIAENASSEMNLDARAASPPWQQAVRLFGLWLLEGTEERRQRWQRIVERSSDGSPAMGILRDLFLDALFLAPNATRLLNQVWDLLIAQDGRLLKKLLDRFFIVATVPDPRIATFVSTPDDVAQLEHLVRIPFWLYWPPVLTILFMRRSSVALVVPYAAAKLCELWLRVAPDEFPFRQQVAELAIQIARELQARNEEGFHFVGEAAHVVYQAMLYGAPLVPEKATALCLELAARIDVSPEIAARATQAHAKRLEKQAQQATPNVRARRPPIMGRRRPQREPWPDGPRGKVDKEFLYVCLSGPPFAGLIRAAPDVALEVLLAVSIEERQEEDFFGGSSLPECGLSYWSEAYPPAYFKGPFHSFFHLAPVQALTFVIKLANFGTHRYTQDMQWLEIAIDGKPKRWYGDPNVYRWHHDGHVMHGAQVQSALMALEQWLYDEIEQDRPIDVWIERIVAESETLAFAGLLMDVGKRLPALFSTSLRPLFFTWELWHWDFQLSNQHALDRQYIAYWTSRPLFDKARAFHLLPHRAEALLALNGAIPKRMLGHEKHGQFFRSVRANWSSHVQAESEDDGLRLLIERINPDNYKFEQQGDEFAPVDFNWPEPFASDNAQSLKKLGEESAMITLPMRCREFLNANHPLPPDQRQWLWGFLQSVEQKVSEPSDDTNALVFRPIDVMLGGIALLLSTSRAWLDEDGQRMTWCRQQLQRTIDHEPLVRGSEVEVSNSGWDSFAAESGLLLLVNERTDPLARSLVAAGVTAHRYATTALTIARAAGARAHLGDEFSKIVALAVRWAALRPQQVRSSDTALDADRAVYNAHKGALTQSYVSNTLSQQLPRLQALNTETKAIRDALHEKQYPDTAARRTRLRKQKEAELRKNLHPDHLALDSQLLEAAFSWLDLRSAQSPNERASWLAQLQELLQLALSTVPVVAPESRQRIDGLPSRFDDWLLQTIARNIPEIASVEEAASLWKPILERGAPAHHWVERFFWHWFTDAFRRYPTPIDFARIWRSMIAYALDHKAWDPTAAVSFDVNAIVVQLLAFDRRWNGLFRSDDNAAAIATVEEIYARSLVYWGRSPRVLSGFAALAVLPAAKSLLLPGINWILPTVRRLHSYDWEHGVEDNIIDFLDVCWTRQREAISNDATLRESFLAILAIVTSRGSAAALALNKRVATSPTS